ncbi:MAG: carbohydrate-binding protein [Oscillospiraceae bacterium]|nr:carbohydrate-binding protein [Oscillospiraceae bacterium]
MKTKKIISAILLISAVLLITSPATLCVNAASEGTKDRDEAAGGKNMLMYPLFLDGGSGAVAAEGPEQLLEYDKNTKYCGGTTYYAVWKYEKAYTIERVILRTANDNRSFPRRMGDGWTLSGSGDGQNWEVMYTGKTDDVKNENMIYFYVDLPDNKTAYEYYKLEADDYAEDEEQLIQLSAFILCVNESAPVPAERPYIAKANVISGYGASIIEAPDFDSGKYYESNAGDGAHDCRPEEEVQTQYCGADYSGRMDENDKPLDGGRIGCIGWTAAGEWVQYTITVKRDGIYRFDAWVASGVDPAGAVELYLNGDGNLIGAAGSVNEGWQAYSKVTAGSAEMTAGEHVLKALFPTGAINLQAVEVVRTGDIVIPTEEAPIAEESEADEAAGPAAEAAAVDEDNEGGAPLVIFVAIGAGLIVIIVVALVFATKKKK